MRRKFVHLVFDNPELNGGGNTPDPVTPDLVTPDPVTRSESVV